MYLTQERALVWWKLLTLLSGAIAIFLIFYFLDMSSHPESYDGEPSIVIYEAYALYGISLLAIILAFGAKRALYALGNTAVAVVTTLIIIICALCSRGLSA